MRRRSFLAGAGALFAASASASGEAAGATEDDAIRIAGREIRLADVLLPSRARLEPYADQSRYMLDSAIAAGVAVRDIAPADRWGRPVVRLFAERHVGLLLATVEERLIASGAARVRPESEDRTFISRLLALERAARDARLGLWALPRYGVLDASDARAGVGAFAIVEGASTRIAKRSGRVFMNFGEDFLSDFTLTARTGLARRWLKAGIDLETLTKARIRARGYMASINGPSIELTHPAQIEVLAEATAGRTTASF